MTRLQKKSNAFTLIELLVVITIIGVLAALAVPAVGGALDRAKQTADVANARQLGIVLFSLANDENGVYPTGPRDSSGNRPASPTGSSTDLFEDMLRQGELKEAKILATNSRKVYTGSLSTPDLKPENVGWDYIGGLSTASESGIPLLVSTQAIGASVNAIKSEITLPSANPSLTTHPWGNKGMIIYTVGNSASFLKARAGGKVNALIDSTVDTTGLIVMPAN